MNSDTVNDVVLIGYSGHAFVVADTLEAAGRKIIAYCDRERKSIDPFDLAFLGPEDSEEAHAALLFHSFLVAIGDNDIRARVHQELSSKGYTAAAAAIHPKAVVGHSVELGDGVLLAPSATVNTLVVVGEGVILNTGCIVEHECRIGAFAHVAPGAILAGNVLVGEKAFIGAGAVVKQGVEIGAGAIVGAGAVVLRDVPPGVTVVGNPARAIGRS